MEIPLTAYELTGTIDDQHQLRLDEDLPISVPKRVRIIVMYPLDGDWDETEWLQAAARSPTFADLAAPEEDIYSLADGKQFDDEA